MAAIQKIEPDERYWSLKNIPEEMITPAVMTIWTRGTITSFGDTVSYITLETAANRVRGTHPEYEGFPDEWGLKVFCGE